MYYNLISPCSYQGGKQRLAPEIAKYLMQDTNSETIFYDICCGSGAISIELINRGIPAKNIVMIDKGCFGAFWYAISNKEFDMNIFENYVNQIPKDKNLIKPFMEELAKTDATIDEVYKYILLQATSFGSKVIWRENNKWCNTSFRSYWQPTATSNRQSPTNPIQPNPTVLFQRINNIVKYMSNIKAFNDDAKILFGFNISSNSRIYIDPPYKNSTGYGFDLDILDYVSKLRKITNAPIFVSERIQFENCQSVKLDFSKEKGGISGNRTDVFDEYLNIISDKSITIIKPKSYKLF